MTLGARAVCRYIQKISTIGFFCVRPRTNGREFLRGGESVDLLNLTPNGRLMFLLPCVAFRFESRFRHKPPVAHRGALHTVVLEPDRLRVIMVWQSALACHVDAHRLEETRIALLRVLNAPPQAVPEGVRFEDE